ncbi:MAG: helix-turn-helix domain-containing protein [Candidatus Hodarchaeota archaeon]
MNSQGKEIDSSAKKKLDLILSTVTKLTEHIESLDQRISRLEGNLDQRLIVPIEFDESESKDSDITERTNFSNLDEHLKRTYQILADANKPMTASEVAERMGRSRSTTSYHLNQLEKLDFLEKFSGTSKDSSRNMFFRPKVTFSKIFDPRE